MAVIDTDSFTYANGNLATVSAGKWTQMAAWTDVVVATNRCRGNPGVVHGSVITTWGGDTTNQYSQVTAATAGDELWLIVKFSGTDTYYMLKAPSGGNFEVWKIVSGGFTLLDSVAQTVANGDIIYFEYNAGALTSKKNGTIVNGPVANTDLAAGKSGIGCYNSTVRFDDWVGGDFSGGSIVPIVGKHYQHRRHRLPANPSQDDLRRIIGRYRRAA